MASTVLTALALAVALSLVGCSVLRKRHSSAPADVLLETVMPASLPKLVSWPGTCSEDQDLVVPVSHNPWHNIIRSHHLGSCPVRLLEDHQTGRVPATIMTATCAPGCQQKRCSLLGNFRCQEVKAKVMVKYILENGAHLHKYEKFPIGCVCAAKSSVEVDLADTTL